jgi:hypothetical protein
MDLNERVARAICDEYHKLDGSSLRYDDLREDSQYLWTLVAKAALSQI